MMERAERLQLGRKPPSRSALCLTAAIILDAQKRKVLYQPQTSRARPFFGIV